MPATPALQDQSSAPNAQVCARHPEELNRRRLARGDVFRTHVTNHCSYRDRPRSLRTTTERADDDIVRRRRGRHGRSLRVGGTRPLRWRRQRRRQRAHVCRLPRGCTRRRPQLKKGIFTVSSHKLGAPVRTPTAWRVIGLPRVCDRSPLGELCCSNWAARSAVT